MKINEPVTQTEEPLDDDSLLISRTDLKGAISFCNEEFIRISGFSRQELEGTNHNIVRHPDMPPEAFGDLWNTVKQGESWKGVVKNRCKNGNFYWVYAHVPPVIEHGQITGYMSVRTKPSTQQVQEASDLYARVNQGSAKLEPTLPNKTLNIRRLLRHKSAILGLAAVSIIAQISTAFVPHGTALGNALSGIGIVLMLSTIVGFYFRETRAEQKAEKRYQDIVEKLNYVLGQSQKAAGRIAQGVRQLEQRNLSLQSRNESQIASVVETQAAIRSLSEQVDTSAAAAQDAAKHSEQSSQYAIDGSEVMRTTIGAMEEISSGSKDIADIIGMIDDIAFQTNLLALNASVEAAHAGDSGRGFAVVATEVRALSQRTTDAALEIKNLISNSSQQVNNGQELVNRSDEHLVKIVDAAKVVSELVGKISYQNSAQNSSISEVNISMDELEKMTMANTELVEQTREAGDFLTLQSASLDELLRFFEVDGSSGDSVRHH